MKPIFCSFRVSKSMMRRRCCSASRTSSLILRYWWPAANLVVWKGRQQFRELLDHLRLDISSQVDVFHLILALLIQFRVFGRCVDVSYTIQRRYHVHYVDNVFMIRAYLWSCGARPNFCRPGICRQQRLSVWRRNYVDFEAVGVWVSE